MGKHDAPNSAACGDQGPYVGVLGPIRYLCMPATMNTGLELTGVSLCPVPADVQGSPRCVIRRIR